MTPSGRITAKVKQVLPRLLGSRIWWIVLFADLGLMASSVMLLQDSGHLGLVDLIGTCGKVVLYICLPAIFYQGYRDRAQQYLRSKPAVGICNNCGYDLTGNVSGICPECGVSIICASARSVPVPIQDELRKHRDGAVPGLIIFGLAVVAGLFFWVRGDPRTMMLGYVATVVGSGLWLYCLIDVCLRVRRHRRSKASGNRVK